MQIKNGASIAGLHLLMRPVLKVAEQIWKDAGRPEGVLITAGLDGIHSAGSWHYYGLALDLRNNYFDEATKKEVAKKLKTALPSYDVVIHSTHIHVEPSNLLAERHGLLITGKL